MPDSDVNEEQSSVVPEDIESWSVDQDVLERNVAKEADAKLRQQDDELDERRLKKAIDARDSWQSRIRVLEDRAQHPGSKISVKEKARADIQEIQRTHLKAIKQDISDITSRINQRKVDSASSQESSTSGRLPGESERDFLVRTGKITPFAKWTEGTAVVSEKASHQQLRVPGEEFSTKRRKVADESDHTEVLKDGSSSKPITFEDEEADFSSGNEEEAEGDDDFIDDKDEAYEESTDGSDSQLEDVEPDAAEDTSSEFKHMDDGNENAYQHRLRNWIAKRRAFRKKTLGADALANDSRPEWELPHPTEPDHRLDDLRIPGDVYSCLFEYQKTGVQWLWELYSQKVGGIVGDEMGLGKTVQIAAFLAAMHHSNKLKYPALIVCPVTVMKQWVAELHRWWPPLRVAVLHSIGSGMANGGHADNLLGMSDDDMVDNASTSKSQANAKSIVDRIFSSGHVIVTTYTGLKVYSRLLLKQRWGYCVLDEGHKIRNPNAEVSLYSKQLKTPHRIILSGTPIQNNLTELWSLFDFVFPGRLGTLPVFQNQFAIPINVGGYANATNVQVQTAYKCAVILRDMISPYMLRRMKSDVAADLPSKQEKVLFCRLTQPQADAYKAFLKSDEMKSILSGKRQVLYGIDILRKICNHPDLVDREMVIQHQGLAKYGSATKSGKMQVVKALIELWKTQGQKTLLFAQTRQMLDILEPFVANLGISYIRMDGSTPIAYRHGLVDRFNTDPSLELFLLTTKVGGLGVNLTGANRVIIFDPDWNPSTDIQARERAWRLGQKREVMIYRLLTAGTIEEKIYHRQIFKQFLTNKILKDPRQRRFFKTGDLHDLFSLGESEVGTTETGGMFSGAEKRIMTSKASPKENKPKNTIIYPGSSERVEYETTERPKDEDDLQQLSQLNGVAGLEDYSKEQDESTSTLSKQSDDAILEGIFAKSGVSSTLEHDAIMDASRPETVLLEREASRVAMLAAKALKESRRVASQAKIGTPTWTGRFGSAGRNTPTLTGNGAVVGRLARNTPRIGGSPKPETKPSSTNLMSSQSILSQMAKKRSLEASDATRLVSDPTIKPQAEMLQNICRYLNGKSDFKASSKDIIQSCNVSMRDTQEVATARQMLKQVANWHKNEGLWQLKDEFR